MYVVILSTEATGPIELYRGTDWDAATAAFHDGIPVWMQRGSRVWEASGFHADHGHGSIELAELCPACGAGNTINGATYCGLCGIDFPDQERAYRMASFFDQANYGRKDARDACTPILLAPLWRNGTVVAEAPARIVGVLSRTQDAYFVEYLHEPGETYAAFGYRMRLV